MGRQDVRVAGMRRFWGGAIWGAIVGVLGLGFVSQLAPVPGVDAPGVAEPAVAPFAEPEPTPVVKPAPAPAPGAEPDTATLAAADPVADRTPAVVADAPAQAVPPEATGSVSPAPLAQAGAPAGATVPLTQPATETAPVLVQVPAQPPASPPTEAPAAQITPEVAVAPVTPTADAPVATTDPAVPANPDADPAPVKADLPPPPPLSPEEQALLDAAIAGAEPLAPVASPIVPATDTATADVAPVPDATPVPEPAADPAADLATLEPQPGLRPMGSIADAAPSTLAPTPSLATKGAVIQRRLPQMDAAVVDAETLPEVDNSDKPPLTRFAAPFENPDAKPLFSIVLIDDGAAGVDRATLATLPFAVSFVLDPLAPGAAEAAALYRAGGKEVLMLATGIPKGATPADLEQTFQAHAAALPEAVAVIDLVDAGFQNDRQLSTQLVPILAAQGRGLLTWDRGLNAADQVARRAALPTAMVYRSLDAEGEDAPVIRRYLDRAAFKAAQEGAVTVVGQTRPETVAALLEWAVEGRASTVALAPVSAVLAGQ